MDAKDIETLIAPALEQEGAELVDLQWRPEGGRWILRLFVDKPGGISLDDCEHFSDRVGAVLDEADAISQSYVLEVSSPGLDRVIKKDKDFERFAGWPVKLRIKVAVDGQRRFNGVLKGLQGGKVAVEVGPDLKLFDRANVSELRLDDAAAADL